MPGRDVDQQVADMALGNRFQVLADGIQVPAGHKLRRGLDHRPSLADELTEAPLGQFLLDLGGQ